MFFGLKENKPLRKRPDDEAKPTLKNPVDRRVFFVLGGIFLVLLVILIILIIVLVRFYL